MAVLFDKVSDLGRFEGKGKVLVQVVRDFTEQYLGFEPERHLILADMNGVRICATIRMNLVDKFSRAELDEGEWYVITNFQVSTRPGPWRLTRHYHHIFFKYYTMVIHIEGMKTCHKLDLRPFHVVLDGRLHNKISVVDVLGALTRVKKAAVYDGQNYLHFTITHTNGRNINYAKGCFITEFEFLWRLQPIGRLIICVLRLWEMYRYGDEIYLSASWPFSELLINPLDIPEVENAKKTFSLPPCLFKMREDDYKDDPIRLENLRFGFTVSLARSRDESRACSSFGGEQREAEIVGDTRGLENV